MSSLITLVEHRARLDCRRDLTIPTGGASTMRANPIRTIFRRRRPSPITLPDDVTYTCVIEWDAFDATTPLKAAAEVVHAISISDGPIVRATGHDGLTYEVDLYDDTVYLVSAGPTRQ